MARTEADLGRIVFSAAPAGQCIHCIVRGIAPTCLHLVQAVKVCATCPDDEGPPCDPPASVLRLLCRLMAPELLGPARANDALVAISTVYCWEICGSTCASHWPFPSHHLGQVKYIQ